MKKFALVIVIIVVIILGVSFALDKINTPSKDPPSEKEARYVVYAGNRYFYTNQYEYETQKVYGDCLIIHGYWEQVGEKWVYRSGDLSLSYHGYQNPPAVEAR